MSYRYIWKITVEPAKQQAFIDNWRKQSVILQEYPGARGTKLTKVLDESNTFLSIAEWESKAARDFMDRDTEEGTSERAKRYRETTLQDDVFGESITVVRVEDVVAVMPKGAINSEEQSNDAVKVAPDFHKVIFENDKLRVLKVTVPQGAKAEMHWHPENINYILSGGKLRFTKPDGAVVAVELAEGQVTSSPAGSHAVEDTGDAEVQTVQVELKENRA